MAIKEALVKILANGEFYSGRVLGEMLGISRSAVWKHMQSLSQYQLEVYAVSGKGYRLANAIDLLDRAVILNQLMPLSAKYPLDIDVLFEVDSTNRYLIDYKMADYYGHRVCLAEYQHVGRGRRGRKWISPFGSNLYCSVLWRSRLSLNALSCLGLIVGVALARALTSLGLVDHRLKWPNDLYWRDCKLGGILIEATGEVSALGRIVIGIGLNVNMPDIYGQCIDQPWIDLTRALDRKVSRNVLAVAVIKEVFIGLSQFEEQGFDVFVEEWRKLDLLHGKPIQVNIGNDVVAGYGEGVDSQGALLVRSNNGAINRYFSGEVSVRYSV